MPYKDKEKAREYSKNYYKEHYEEARKRSDEYMRTWRQRNLERWKSYQREYKLKLKVRALQHYSGGDTKCDCCGETKIGFLTLDHVDNDGAEHRKRIGIRGGWDFYRWLRNNGYPDIRLQVLCWNCNVAKSMYGECPHQTTVGRSGNILLGGE